MIKLRDRVWIIKNNKLLQLIVYGIQSSVSLGSPVDSFVYDLSLRGDDCGSLYNGDSVFKSRAELIDWLIESSNADE